MSIDERPDEKKRIRSRIMEQRKSMAPEYAAEIGRCIVRNITAMDEYKAADVIYTYASVRNEADIGELFTISIALGKTVLLPRVAYDGKMEFFSVRSADELTAGYMNIPEPDISRARLYTDEDMSGALSFMAVPGVAFDMNGGRIGMGKGFYDRYLSCHTIDTVCGVCGEYQLLKGGSIIMDSHDIYMDCVATENKIYGGNRDGAERDRKSCSCGKI